MTARDPTGRHRSPLPPALPPARPPAAPLPPAPVTRIRATCRPSVLARGLALAALALAALILVACGSSSPPGPTSPPPAVLTGASSAAASLPSALPRPAKVTLILDFVPNAVHVGIYRALAAGYYKRENIDLQVVQPTSTQETLKLIDAGKAQFGLADGSDVAGLINAGGDAQAVMALVQRPLGGLIALASEHLASPASLAGKTVGITGVPSDLAVLDTELRHAGVSPSRVHVVTVGFNGPQALLAGRISAFTGFIPDEGVTLQAGGGAGGGAGGHPITSFALDENGGPVYPGLVAFTTRKLIAADPLLVRDFVAATTAGYQDALRDPARALDDLLSANPGLPRGLTAASLAVYLPLFSGRSTTTSATSSARLPFGMLQSANVAAMSRWMLASHLIDAPISPARYGTNRFLRPAR